MSNIYIDTSFFSSYENTKNMDVDYSASDASLIGVYNFQTDINIKGEDSLQGDNDLDAQVVVSLLDFSEGNVNLDTVFGRYNTSVNLMDVPVYFTSYSGSGLSSGTMNSFLDYFAGYIASPSGTGVDVTINYIAGEYFVTSYNYLSEYWVFPTVSGVISSDISYMNYTGTLNPSGIPIAYYYNDINRELEYGISSGSGTEDLMNYPVDLFFSGWVKHPLSMDCISALLNTQSFYIDSELGKGKKEGYLLDTLSTKLRERHAVDFDVFSALVDYYELVSEVTTISGTKQCLYNDVFSTLHSDFGCEIDINLFSIYFDNFNIDKGDYVNLNSSVCVDAHDAVYGLVASGTYFKINDNLISGSLTEISDGFRMCFDVEDNIHLFSGITKITARAENYNNEVLEEDYYLTSGYIVDFINNQKSGIDFGFGERVYIRMEAENLASCPEIVTDGYYFTSRIEYNSDLSAYIFPVGGYYSDSSNLTASIYPQSTAYFYDKEFEVVIKVKDYAGNEIEPYVINFRIYNPDE